MKIGRRARVSGEGKHLQMRIDGKGLLAFVCWVTISTAGVVGPSLADAARSKIAVMPFELSQEQRIGMRASISPEEANRLQLATQKLVTMLQESGSYEIVDISSIAAEIEDASPLFKCNGCEVDLAKKVGSQLVSTGVIHKASPTLINVSIFIRDVATGEPKHSMAVSIRENNDAGWVRGVRSLVRNRLLSKADQ